MKILLVEDSGSVAYPLTEYLEGEGHKVLVADNCAMSQDFWDEGGIDCLIVDLNMEPNGLNSEEIKKTRGGLFTGWEWLSNYVFPKNEAMRKKTIILTAYDKEFKEIIPSGARTGVKVISKKTGQGNVYEEILSFVKAIGKE